METHYSHNYQICKNQYGRKKNASVPALIFQQVSQKTKHMIISLNNEARRAQNYLRALKKSNETQKIEKIKNKQIK